MKPAEIKIIDFGSACMEDRTVYSYIQVHVYVYLNAFILFLSPYGRFYDCIFLFILQSRYYRSPEVLLGYQYPFKLKYSF